MRRFEWISMVIGAGVIALACSSCVPGYLVDYVHEVPVAADYGLKQGTLAEKDEVFTELKTTGLVVAEKIGTSTKSITTDNVMDNLKQTKVDAENYEPWQPPLTGIVWIDGIIAIAAGLLTFKMRNRIRVALHFLTHITKPAEVKNTDESSGTT